MLIVTDEKAGHGKAGLDASSCQYIRGQAKRITENRPHKKKCKERGLRTDYLLRLYAHISQASRLSVSMRPFRIYNFTSDTIRLLCLASSCLKSMF